PGDEAAYFGCRRCRVSRQVDDPYERNSWIRYGSLTRKRDAFRVDKQAILRALAQDTRASACILCPAFRWQRVRADVHDLPDVIKLGPDSKFQVRYAAFNPDQALGIELKAAANPGGVPLGLESPTRDGKLGRPGSATSPRHATSRRCATRMSPDRAP